MKMTDDEGPTLNQVLALMGYTHEPNCAGLTHRYIRRGRVVFRGTVNRCWLRMDRTVRKLAALGAARPAV